MNRLGLVSNPTTEMVFPLSEGLPFSSKLLQNNGVTPPQLENWPFVRGTLAPLEPWLPLAANAVSLFDLFSSVP